jgi:hypothetical protein
MPRRGVIYTVAPSPVDGATIWAGTDDGLIQVTRDGGKNWKNVTPPEISDWQKVSLIDAGHFDAGTAYAAVNGIRIDDMHPHIYKTHDGGRTWTAITNGLPDEPINVVREDPGHKGLLLAGSESCVYISFDDGAQWEPLRLNMPATSCRDLVFKDADVVVGTHGRSFWIMDDITPLRQLGAARAAADAVLYKPEPAIRIRWDMNTDTPLPQDEPAGENPPDGAVIDYYLKAGETKPVTLDILDAAGVTVRHYSSTDTLYKIPDVNIPTYWIRPQQLLSAAAGPHRFLWDLHYQPLNVPASYPIAAIYANTAPSATSPWVMPGTYTVKLTAGGKTYTQPLTVRMDPRVKTPVAALQQQHDLALAAYHGRAGAMETIAKIKALRVRIAASIPQAGGERLTTLQQLDAKAAGLEGQGRRFGRGAATQVAVGPVSFSQLQGDYTAVLGVLEEADMAPTMAAQTALQTTEQAARTTEAAWKALQQEATKLNIAP